MQAGTRGLSVIRCVVRDVPVVVLAFLAGTAISAHHGVASMGSLAILRAVQANTDVALNVLDAWWFYLREPKRTQQGSEGRERVRLLFSTSALF